MINNYTLKKCKYIFVDGEIDFIDFYFLGDILEYRYKINENKLYKHNYKIGGNNKLWINDNTIDNELYTKVAKEYYKNNDYDIIERF